MIYMYFKVMLLLMSWHIEFIIEYYSLFFLTFHHCRFTLDLYHQLKSCLILKISKSLYFSTCCKSNRYKTQETLWLFEAYFSVWFFLATACPTNKYGWDCTKTCFCKNSLHCNRYTGPTDKCECKDGYFNPPFCQAGNPPSTQFPYKIFLIIFCIQTWKYLASVPSSPLVCR